MDYVTRGVCGQEGCRERRYYIDNGLWYCRRGHLQEGVQVAEDGDDFGNLGKVHRVKKEIREKSTKTLHGRPAWTLFLQIYQLILWKQSHALVHDHGFPEELEIVVRDLWALRLPDYKLKITDSNEDEDVDTNREVFSSQVIQSDDSEVGFKPNSRFVEWPRLIDAVGLCYIAALLMRVPVCVNDFYDMIIQQQIPFTRVTASVPPEMREKLPPELTGILESNKLPEVGHLHNAVQALSLFYQRRFEVVLPPLNWPVLLFRHIKRLALPIEVYDAVKNLKNLLNVTFEYPKPKATIEQKKSHHYPDVELVVLIVIATKLLFPFDDVKRYPTTNMEPATQIMDWSQWALAQTAFDSDSYFKENIGKDAAVRITDSDVLNMSTDQLDHYMDWYADSWLDTSAAPGRLAEMFPIQRGDAQPNSTIDHGPPSDPAVAPDTTQKKLDTLLHEVMQNIKPRRVIPGENEEPKRPGEVYRRYRWESQLSGTARTFYEIAAQLAAVPLKTLVRAVTLAEYKIAKSDERRQRREFFENQGVEVDDSDADQDLEIEDSDEDQEF
ncbi:unnamed protein product [Penicillium salamii]|uniref:RRN7-type domain-containing protein n=1 Tax=Penicillium salamii TaxID=1612424 RepID=A0A9W4K6U6_9EURO|nr:unnamed protein product [Penicillium salamii]CAG8105376.1 unnamed protein product [Penicillium salamii]CAG8186333.1 unnamed protein product [Penicillium salamii]CAG8247061.1 unnamed protein product [Penicillium salamii]CAG8280960.1 unnamed protein product [Penicillium salamii]